jgi:hypothetical protein
MQINFNCLVFRIKALYATQMTHPPISKKYVSFFHLCLLVFSDDIFEYFCRMQTWLDIAIFNAWNKSVSFQSF